MQPTQHTAGPWMADLKDTESPVVWGAGELVCLLHQDVTTDDYIGFGRELEPLKNAEANARLIAAAPELLAMLKAANHALYVVGKPSALKAALAGSADLIRKAEGRA